MKSFKKIVLLFFFSYLSCVAVENPDNLKKTVPDNAIDVPAEFKTIFNQLSNELTLISQQMQKVTYPDQFTDTHYGVDLLIANSNRGENLFVDKNADEILDVYQGIHLTLDRLKKIGVNSISISIQIPLLLDFFPNSREYCQFYKEIAKIIKNKGFELVVDIGTLFKERIFSQVEYDYTGYDLERLSQEIFDTARKILIYMKPDFLTLISEPDTQMRNMDINFTVTDFYEMISHIAKIIENEFSNLNFELGAGAGTWNEIEYFEGLARISELDYLDLHIYPIYNGFALDKVEKIHQVAKKYNKYLTIGETWLYKIGQNEYDLLSGGYTVIFLRDVFSFWHPLDQFFIEIIVNLTHKYNIRFVSFFWMRYFYGYLDYNKDTSKLTNTELIIQCNKAAGNGIINNILTPTGEKFKTLINSY